MSIPSLPTDNLYKFVALSGVLIFIILSYIVVNFISDSQNRVDTLNMEIVIYNSRYKNNLDDILFLKESRLEWDGDDIKELDRLEKEQKELSLNLAEINHNKSVVKKLDETILSVVIFWLISIVISIIMMIYGFSRWYYRVQRHLDKKIKKEAE